MSKQFYFDGLVLSCILSFCGPCRKPVGEFLTTGVYVVKKPQSVKKFHILEINEKWIVVSSEWKKGVVSIKKIRNNDPKESKTLGITPFNKLECLFEEKEWKSEKEWRRQAGISIPYRIFNLKKDLTPMCEPLPFFDAMLVSEELEHLLLWREIKERESAEEVDSAFYTQQSIERIKWTRGLTGVSTPEELEAIRYLEGVLIPLRHEQRERTLQTRRAREMLKILNEEA